MSDNDEILSDMETITKRYLSRNTADALALAHRDGAVAVTERNEVRWTIVAGAAKPDPLAGLAGGLTAELPHEPIPWGDDAWNGRAYTGADIDAIVSDMKGEF